MSSVPVAASDHVRQTPHCQTVEVSAWKDLSVMRATFGVEMNVFLSGSVAALLVTNTTSMGRFSTLMPYARWNAPVMPR